MHYALAKLLDPSYSQIHLQAHSGEIDGSQIKGYGDTRAWYSSHNAGWEILAGNRADEVNDIEYIYSINKMVIASIKLISMS